MLGVRHFTVLAAAAAAVCLVVFSTSASSRSAGASELLGDEDYASFKARLHPSKLAQYPNAMKTLVGAAAYEISALDSASPESESESESRGTNTYGRLHVPMQGLTTDPQVAGYMFNNENGDWDGTAGPDKGWVPYGENEPCQDGICYEEYARSPRTRQPSLARYLRGHTWAAKDLRMRIRANRVKRAANALYKQTGARLQSLGEVDDFPDITENAEVNDVSENVKDIYRPFAPLGSEENQVEPTDSEPYAAFYRAYAAYQLPHQVSNWPSQWVPEIDSLGKANLPPHAYPYSDTYYPGTSQAAAITINANGDYSTNSFHVSGPQAINVNIGSSPGGDTNGYVYPDGKTAVPSRVSLPTIKMVGAPAYSSGKDQVNAGADEATGGNEAEAKLAALEGGGVPAVNAEATARNVEATAAMGGNEAEAKLAALEGGDRAAGSAEATASNAEATASNAEATAGNGEATANNGCGDSTVSASCGQEAYGAMCDPSNPDCNFWQDAYDDYYY